MSALSRVTLLGVPLDPVTTHEAVVRLMALLEDPAPHHVATPNSEMLVEAHRNAAFRRVLQHAALNLPDSVGLLFMARFTGQNLPARVTGVDTVHALCARLPADHPVFLLGAPPGIAPMAAAALIAKNLELRIVGTFSGSPRSEDAQAMIDRINAASPHLLLVAFGAPAQDLWIADHLKDLPSVRVAMGVGGTFDFLAGERARAPRVFQYLGLEWLWRLVLEPRRWKRIWNAVVVFPLLVVRHRQNRSS
ncbi:WecB/TagA/CpsF family glycosyltransferase [Candidatus Peregrinibacteria bacterium]|nr:WecB/TagA/CpsF family glycosyltransferase [Candidatus Peregrinibacteria bacterium]MBI3816770.1 WecB/TagA/CpsF family glycosyltransferase [Candidatus Peregrinibacteria bacterium]